MAAIGVRHQAALPELGAPSTARPAPERLCVVAYRTSEGRLTFETRAEPRRGGLVGWLGYAVVLAASIGASAVLPG